VNPTPANSIKELLITADPQEETSVQFLGISALLLLDKNGMETKSDIRKND
jgi:hypothetical protein